MSVRTVSDSSPTKTRPTRANREQASLRTHQRMFQINKTGVSISFLPVGVWLLKALFSEASHYVEPRSFDRFLTSSPIWLRGEEERLCNTARLMLRHPAKPSGVPLLEFWKMVSSSLDLADRFVKSLLRTEGGPQLTALFFFFVSSAQLLK